MLQAEDVGHRVVVRRIVGIREGRALFAEALGELVELDEIELTMATDRGLVRIPRTQVRQAKRVPPARRRATAVAALELAADEAWPAPVRERLGDWLLRFADGWTGRANSALPIGEPSRPLSEAIDALQNWYADRGQPAIVNTPLPLAEPIAAELESRGWLASPPIQVRTAPPAAILTALHAETTLPAVELATTPSDAWLCIAAGRKGGLPPAAQHVLTAVNQVRFAHVYASGELVAIGRGTITGQGRWLGLTLMEVIEPARRQGYARHVLRALAQWGEQGGATHAFLQVEPSNVAAVSLYRRAGFVTHHTYRTWRAPA